MGMLCLVDDKGDIHIPKLDPGGYGQCWWLWFQSPP